MSTARMMAANPGSLMSSAMRMTKYIVPSAMPQADAAKPTNEMMFRGSTVNVNSTTRKYATSRRSV